MKKSKEGFLEVLIKDENNYKNQNSIPFLPMSQSRLADVQNNNHVLEK